MSTQVIHISGARLGVAITGSYLAARWLGPNRALVLSPDNGEGSGEILLRPDAERFHAEMGMSPQDLAAKCGARPALSTQVVSTNGPVKLPFSPVGLPNAGVEFHHFWLRASHISNQPDLLDFSLSLALEEAGQVASNSALSQLRISFGMICNHARYAEALLAHAQSCGAQVSDNASRVSLRIECRDDESGLDWLDDVMRIGASNPIPGMDWHRLAAAARRFIKFAAPLDDCEAERREWNRLAEAEAERIADMQELLSMSDPNATVRAALKRKFDLFRACGRIPTEDYEVFSQPEWLVALWSRGPRPQRYDRLADRMNEAELLNWLAQMHQQIRQIAGKARAA